MPNLLPPPSLGLAAVLGGCTGDTLLAIAVALPSRTDLLRFALARRLYFTTTSYDSAVPSGAASAASGGGSGDVRLSRTAVRNSSSFLTFRSLRMSIMYARRFVNPPSL